MKKKMKTFFMLFTILSVAVLISSEASAEVRVNLKEKSMVRQKGILLKQITDIEGNSRKSINEVGSISVGVLPLPGMSKTLNKDYIESKIRIAGSNIRKVSLNGPEEITVTRDFREITYEEIKEILRRYIKKQASKGGIKVELKGIRYSGRVLLPHTRNIEYEVIPSSQFHYVGTNFFYIAFKSKGRILKKLKVETETDMKVSVVFAARPIERGHIISKDDIYLAEKDVSAVPQRALFDPDEVVGKKAKRNISVSSMLKKNLVEYPSAIKKGDLVTILAESGGLRISTKGEAVEDGILGEMIRVKNLRSKKVVGGVVVQRGIVKVDF